MSHLETENAMLRQQVANFDHCLTAFADAAEGVIAELDGFIDACAGDPAVHERARAAGIAAAERMHALLHEIGCRFPTYLALQDAAPASVAPAPIPAPDRAPVRPHPEPALPTRAIERARDLRAQAAAIGRALDHHERAARTARALDQHARGLREARALRALGLTPVSL